MTQFLVEEACYDRVQMEDASRGLPSTPSIDDPDLTPQQRHELAMAAIKATPEATT